MENIGPNYEEFFDSTTGQRLEPISNKFRFDYAVLKLLIEITLAYPEPVNYLHTDDLDKYDKLTILHSECDDMIEQKNYEQILFAAISYYREKSKRII
jgi:hypothetical protein